MSFTDLSSAVIAGIIGGIIVITLVIIILVVLLVFIYCRKGKQCILTVYVTAYHLNNILVIET